MVAPRIRILAALVAVACGMNEPESAGTTSDAPTTTSGGPPTSTASHDDTSGAAATTSSADEQDGGDTSAAAESEDSSTGVEVPDFDALPWQTGDDVGFGIAYKDLRTSESSLEDIFVSLVHEQKAEV